MHSTLRWTMRCLAAICLTIALPASAHLQFTYTSQPLPMSSYLVDGWPYDLGESMPPPAFTFSFTAPEQNLTQESLVHYVGENFTFALISPDADYIYYSIDIKPASYAQVSLNAKGEVAGWDFMLAITELITPETDMFFYNMSDHEVRVTSNSETGDLLRLRFHPITWHRHWIQLAQLEIDFSGAQSGHWTVDKISVPEPPLVGLLLIGLLMLIWSREHIKRTPIGRNSVVTDESSRPKQIHQNMFERR